MFIHNLILAHLLTGESRCAILDIFLKLVLSVDKNVQKETQLEICKRYKCIQLATDGGQQLVNKTNTTTGVVLASPDLQSLLLTQQTVVKV